MDIESRIGYYLDFAVKYPHVFDNSLGQLEILLDKDMIISKQKELYKMAEKKKQPLHWYDIGIVSEDAWTVVIRDLVRFPDGSYGGYIRLLNRKSGLERKGKDVVILVQNNNRLLIMHHFRHEDRSYHWECPRGFGEDGLTAAENARKEVGEETGFSVDELIQLNSNNESVSYFFAKCSGAYKQMDKGESISKIQYVTDKQFSDMIADSVIDDFYTIRAYTLAKLKKLL